MMNRPLPAVTEADVLFDLSPDLLCYTNSQGHFTKINNAFSQALGYAREDILSRPLLHFIEPQDWEETTRQVAALSRNETVRGFTNRYRCSDGSYRWLCWNGFKLPDGSFFGSARDITADQLVRDELVQANELKERKLISLIESGNDIILILSAQGVYQFVSPSVKTILDSDPEFYLGKVTFAFIHPEDLDRVMADFVIVLDTEKPVSIPPFRFQVASGEWVWIETVATNRLSDPAIEGIVINAKNVTTKRNEEQEKLLIAQQLAFSNERYSLAIEATQDVIWDWDLKTDKISWGKGFEKYFGKDSDPEQLKTNYWKGHFHPEDKKRVIKNFQADISSPEVRFWKEEYRLLKDSGEVIFINDHGYIIRDADLKAVRIIGSMHDVTERMEKEQQIIRQNEQLIEFALINSHELRRPVATILGLVDLIDRSCITDPENREIIGHLEITVKELDAVIRHINERITG